MTQDQTIQLLREKATRLRIHSLRATTAAGSGHPTICLSAADLEQRKTPPRGEGSPCASRAAPRRR